MDRLRTLSEAYAVQAVAWKRDQLFNVSGMRGYANGTKGDRGMIGFMVKWLILGIGIVYLLNGIESMWR